MKRARYFLLVTFLPAAILLTSSSAVGQDADSADNQRVAVAEATEAAKRWLAVVDSAGWAQSYRDAAQYFKASVAQDVWMRQIKGVRTPLGRIRSRSLSGSQYATSLPGAPDGEYVVLTFSASFENKANAVETVTPMKDPDGQWRVSGYYIR